MAKKKLALLTASLITLILVERVRSGRSRRLGERVQRQGDGSSRRRYRHWSGGARWRPRPGSCRSGRSRRHQPQPGRRSAHSDPDDSGSGSDRVPGVVRVPHRLLPARQGLRLGGPAPPRNAYPRARFRSCPGISLLVQRGTTRAVARREAGQGPWRPRNSRLSALRRANLPPRRQERQASPRGIWLRLGRRAATLATSPCLRSPHQNKLFSLGWRCWRSWRPWRFNPRFGRRLTYPDSRRATGPTNPGSPRRRPWRLALSTDMVTAP